MDEPARKKLRLLLRIALSMLPRYLRHDLWRTAEPHHERAVDSIAERMATTVEDRFELQEKPPKLTRSSTL